MTGAEVVAALSGPRLPLAAATLSPGALVAAFGFGLLIALALFLIARPAFRARRRAASPAEHLAALARLPAEARPLAAARLFVLLGARPPEALATTLYRADAGNVDMSGLEPALTAAWRAASAEARRGAHV